MRYYQLSPKLSLIVKPCPPAFRYFVGKTNRLVLVSLSAFGVSLDLYIARQWEYPAWDEQREC